MAEEKKLSVGEIVRRLDELLKDEKVQEYIQRKDALWVRLELSTLTWARCTVG